MKKIARVSRFHVALAASLAFFVAGCNDAQPVQDARSSQENGELLTATDVTPSDRSAENVSETEPEKTLADRRAAESAQNAKINKECNDYLNQTALELFNWQISANSQDPEKIFSSIGDIYVKLLANLRSLDASGCSLEFQNAFNGFVAHIEKMVDTLQELQTLQQRLANEEGDAESLLADANRVARLGNEFQNLSDQINSEAKKLEDAM